MMLYKAQIHGYRSYSLGVSLVVVFQRKAFPSKHRWHNGERYSWAFLQESEFWVNSGYEVVGVKYLQATMTHCCPPDFYLQLYQYHYSKTHPHWVVTIIVKCNLCQTLMPCASYKGIKFIMPFEPDPCSTGERPCLHKPGTSVRFF